MAGINKTKAALRISGETSTPTSWTLKTQDRSLGDLSAQIKSIFSMLTEDLGVWERISKRYKCDFFCGLFMNEMNEGLSLSPGVLGILSDRGVVLALDIYHPTAD